MFRQIGMTAIGFAMLAGGQALAVTAKEQDCIYQAQVVEAVRQARIARVEERLVPDVIMAGEPSWPEKYNAVISLVAPWVYEMEDITSQDPATAWKEACLSQ